MREESLETTMHWTVASTSKSNFMKTPWLSQNGS